MKESWALQASAKSSIVDNQSMEQVKPSRVSTFQVLNDDPTQSKSRGIDVSSPAYTEEFFTLESTPVTGDPISNSSAAVSISSNRSDLSSHCSQSYASDLHHSCDYTCDSSFDSSAVIDNEAKLMHALWMLRNDLLGPESGDSGSFSGVTTHPLSSARYNKILEMAAPMDLKQLLVACAETVSEADSNSSEDRRFAFSAAEVLLDMLGRRVSVYGDPLQRLGAYVLEGLKARLLSSGSIIYKKLNCNEPASSELMSYMHVLYEICPYYKFAYVSANAVIREAMVNESRIHVIDFQIAQGSQWVSFIQSLSSRPGGPPYLRITGVDDLESAHARGGGLELVCQRLGSVAEACGVPFEFHGAGMSGCEVHYENLKVRKGESLAVNFPYILHHMPDESVSTTNHRDRLLRLVKNLSPRIVTLSEQESNTNTSSFFQRFLETLDFYTAIFESIDAVRLRDDRQRISTEEHCVGKDIVNIIACEGIDRLERHELLGKWRLRLTMAGFSPVPLNSSVSNTARDVLRDYSKNYRIAEANGALYLGWKNRALYTSSAWR
ncbi:scarecrow-like protein 13-like [Dorcoceras hygrometricum]|uniref:Scarecrow-like protein 13-like n=1 Tax=Dorcoceras hygrometricum TaxID=472368 RepID=A0A2Z7CVZ8_9LAMI|nr:scarecrow-like protein 13-like [Dorcoceras hygrometricum]